MSTTTWKEIQQLAADLQRVQLAEGTKKLSEFNCVELIGKLIAEGIVDLVVTDAKEYVTRKHLVTEVQNECIAAGGRMAMTDLAAQLSVELDHISAAICTLTQQSNNMFLVCAGELVHRDFIEDLCKRLNSRLSESGQLSMQTLTKQWELSTELLHNYVLPEIGRKIGAVRIEDQLYTINFMKNLHAKLSAILSALTKPIQLSTIQGHLGTSPALFFKIWVDVSNEQQIPGKLLGTKNSVKSLFVPTVHMRMCEEFVRKRLVEDHYIERNILKKLSVVDFEAFVQKVIPKKDAADMLYFPSVILSESKLWDECESLARNFLKSRHFCLIEDILPPTFSFLGQDDLLKVIELLQKNSPANILRCTEDNSIVFEYTPLLANFMNQIDEWISAKADTDAVEMRKAIATTSLKQQQNKQQLQKEKDDWEVDKPGKKKGASGKKSTNQKSTKNLATDEGDGGILGLRTQILSRAELIRQLRTKSDQIQLPDPLLDALSEDFVEAANAAYNRALNEAIAKRAVDDNGAEALERRKVYEEQMAKCRETYTSICVFEKGAEEFADPLRSDLLQYLLRTRCTELAEHILYALTDFQSNQSPLLQKLRDQLITELEDKTLQTSVKTLFESLTTSVEQFHDTIFKLTSNAFLLRQPDKKSRTEFIESYITELRQQLASCDEPATSLLIIVLLLLHDFHAISIHASGKFVSPLINFLCSPPKIPKINELQQKKELPSELVSALTESQKLVVQSFSKKNPRARRGNETTEQDSDDHVSKELTEKIALLKRVVQRNDIQ